MSKYDFEVCIILKGEEQVEFKKSICACLFGVFCSADFVDFSM
jgi:hypothetical protein